jgi:sphingomyelin phosphodiesterase acid-like 3
MEREIKCWCGWIAVGLLLGSVALAQTPTPAAEPAVAALMVSDIHFDPFHDPAKAERLASEPLSSWRAILDAPDSVDLVARTVAMRKACPARATDTDERLFAASLAAMRGHASGLRFVTVSGDLMAHQFDCRFRQVFPKATGADYRGFALKTMEYELGELRKALPGVPVYAALGNNDSDCGDYRLDAHGAFLAGAARFFLADLSAGERARAEAQFADDGSYTVALPGVRARLVVVDNLFASRGYLSCAGKPDPAPAAAQVAWLQRQMETARASGEKLWVMGHIPPGIDPYATVTKLRNICGGEAPVPFLATDELGKTLASGGDVISLALFAHTHMDEMHLLEPPAVGGHGPVALKMVPSITTINGNRPAFTLVSVDAVTGALKDYRVIASADNRGSTWAEEYDYATTYGEPDFSSVSAARLVRGMVADRQTNSAAVQSYLRLYYGRDLSAALKPFWSQYACSLTNLEAESYRRCLCGETREAGK